MNNGGFSQFFENWGGSMAIDAEASLRAIGADHAADIVAEAVSRFPDGSPPGDREARRQRVAGASLDVLAAWERLDQSSFAYPDDLTALLYAWVKAHPEEFGPVP